MVLVKDLSYLLLSILDLYVCVEQCQHFLLSHCYLRTWNEVVGQSCNEHLLAFQSCTSCAEIIAYIVSKPSQQVVHSHIRKESQLCLWHGEQGLLCCDDERSEGADSNSSSHYNPIPTGYLQSFELRNLIIQFKLQAEELSSDLDSCILLIESLYISTRTKSLSSAALEPNNLMTVDIFEVLGNIYHHFLVDGVQCLGPVQSHNQCLVSMLKEH